ncbi:uncharacterized protein LOC127846651 [Dreissena polymorpha]|nr:uncharacterized protein LOC127846651 [Dreissena polymorpha]
MVAFEMEPLAEPVQVDETESHGIPANSNHGRNHTAVEPHPSEPDDASNPELFNKPSDASDPELFMQKVYCDLSKEMDGYFRMFFRKNGISDSAISVILEEEKRVYEQCYKLFRAWENNQTDVRELPAMEIPLELVRRLTSMFREDTGMHCSCTCLEILERYENAWFRKCRHKNTRT